MLPLNGEQLPEFLRRHGFRMVEKKPMWLFESARMRVRVEPYHGAEEAQVASIVAPDRWWSMPEIIGALGWQRVGRQSAERRAMVALMAEEFPDLDRLAKADAQKAVDAFARWRRGERQAFVKHDAQAPGFKRVRLVLAWSAAATAGYLLLSYLGTRWGP